MVINKHIIKSLHLSRDVQTDVYLPASFRSEEALPFLLLNDGQDATALKLESIFKSWHQNKKNPRFVLIALHAGDRIQEYGVIGVADFKKRGAKAALHANFVIKECLPFLVKNYGINLHHPLNAYAGFSLGALSAFSTSWNYPEIFRRTGAFSGAFWWRSKDLDKGYNDHDRIMHAVVRKSEIRQGMCFWFQAGSEDEKSDRNNNGIIDAIEDTVDLIATLIQLGYKPYYDITYYEVKGGKHNQETWSAAFPLFLRWLFKG
jgi:enterochelin esterase-like enzyme